jgi:brefeldin A-inhibited guanine nucleotide-exchange protein
MFESVWGAYLSTFSVILEDSQDPKVYNLCIEAFLHSIKICGFFRMVTERDAFVSSLTKFTQINNQR